MILYLDASALVKRYVAEIGSAEVSDLIASADLSGTSVISRAETVAALAKAIRLGYITQEGGEAAVSLFRDEWTWLIRLQATETLMARADSLAWELGLRGYYAVHLASALIWQEALEQSVTLATFDRQLWRAASRRGLELFPEDLDLLQIR